MQRDPVEQGRGTGNWFSGNLGKQYGSHFSQCLDGWLQNDISDPPKRKGEVLSQKKE